MANITILRNSLYGVLGSSIVMYLILLILFSIDKAYAAIAIALVGIIAASVGIFGTRRESFAGLMTFSAMAFAWILLGIIHLAIIANLFRTNNPQTDSLFVGETLLSKDNNNPRVKLFNILYLTIYSLGITLTAVGIMLSCLLPTPDGTGWRYPWMRSKASLAGDPYYDEWDDEFNPPYPYPFLGPTMMLGIPATPMMAMPPPPHSKGMFRGGMSRSMPSVYDPRMGYGGGRHGGNGRKDGDNNQSSGGYRSSSRRRSSSSNLGYKEEGRDVSPPPSAAHRRDSSDRRASFDFNSTRRRSSAADNYGFL